MHKIQVIKGQVVTFQWGILNINELRSPKFVNYISSYLPAHGNDNSEVIIFDSDTTLKQVIQKVFILWKKDCVQSCNNVYV